MRKVASVALRSVFRPEFVNRLDEIVVYRRLERAQVPRDLQAAHAGHLDVEEEHARAARGQPLDHLQAVGRFARHARRDLGAHVGEQLLQALARRLLVVGDEDRDLFAVLHARAPRSSAPRTR